MLDTLSSQSALTQQLVDRIEREGPITFHDWMQAALYDAHHGYYVREGKKKWGREGDYRTSPERSSLFAATFARYFAELFQRLGSPNRWTIVEGGAGEGRFAAGVLQTLKGFFPQVFSATQYVIDEIGPTSNSVARQNLAAFAEKIEFRKLRDVVIDPGIIFSNELLDAFPVHRVKWCEGRLQELYVDHVDNGFGWRLGPLSTDRLSSYFADSHIQLNEGQTAEVNLALTSWLETVSRQLKEGYHIVVDYGDDAAEIYSPATHFDGTLRGFKAHQFVEDLLQCPGEHDLTTTVDWSFVKRAGEQLGLRFEKLERQDRFLLAAGLLDQLESELQGCTNEADRLRLSTAAREMILPGGLATSFQVLVQRKF